MSDAIGQLDDFNTELGELGKFDFSGWDQDFMDEWDALLKNNIQLGEKEGLSKDFITKIWNTIHEESLNIQENI